ncbi:hypothetical protein BDN70DRAFT_883792 [Pholiota conissans]|uniref:Uncharacterized protein n=1 Tax=Pholiota conissans TaxID=109636 RepID=A0A9P5YTW0_9AGAR|nr:hypothetical protein BDN70DRAFT_883792 [Pholiota conissans]
MNWIVVRGYLTTSYLAPAHASGRHIRDVQSNSRSTELRLGERWMSTSTLAPELPVGHKRRGLPRIPMPSTLRPENIASSSEQIWDFSGKAQTSVWTSDGRKSSIYYAIKMELGSKLRPRIRFPPNTKGYFYYHASPDHSELAGSIRFRLCEGPKDFDRGHDLLTPSGQPWGYNLLDLAIHPGRKELLALIHAEGLADEETISDLAKLGLPQEHHKKPFLFSLADPFVFDLSASRACVRILTRKKLIRVDFRMNMFGQLMRPPVGESHWICPLIGSVKLQFELSTLPEHASFGPTLVLRVLEVVRPITMDPNYTGRVVAPPTPGTLVYRTVWGKKRIVCFPILRQKMSVDILELARKAWPNTDI